MSIYLKSTKKNMDIVNTSWWISLCIAFVQAIINSNGSFFLLVWQQRFLVTAIDLDVETSI